MLLRYWIHIVDLYPNLKIKQVVSGSPECYAVLCQVEVMNLENHSHSCSTRIYQIPLNALKEGHCPGFLQDGSLLASPLSLAFHVQAIATDLLRIQRIKAQRKGSVMQ